ncbi:MAG: DUF4160 domain-containing protein [Bacteroidia bacterium]|nr:DUF4160 domain-containing protein [Bacteroidia bacterium]
MPEISRFFGIEIKMYWADHQPPHFHAVYGADMALVDIRALRAFAGHLPARALGLVIEWAALHQKELLANWDQAQKQEPIGKIDPLR